MKEITLSKPVLLFQYLNKISLSKDLNNRSESLLVGQLIRDSEDLCNECGFESTLHHIASARDVKENGLIDMELRLIRLKSHISAAISMMSRELEVSKVGLLDDSVVSPRFSSLKESLSESGKLFHEETIKCARIGAYRACLINAWTLCMDSIQSWIIDDDSRLSSFNEELLKSKRNDKSIYSEVKTKEDFWEAKKSPGERTVLDCIQHKIGEKIYRRILTALDERNTYAHANSAELERDKVTGYISSIVDIIDAIQKRI
ncbi:hypothetical protein [Rubinisphaera italica]|uniref:RiboL-PSP-HEPN domain-containing protein n=1 Tax=Rubinisphaera italica TaxID=2527969 RepID=A0A5C5XM73_9PLAN|nr:hypothetical protein [Rubinisphaera italica]TWT64257.1 hypothetical protein Pan54_50180 [Rubinisphaera italica]